MFWFTDSFQFIGLALKWHHYCWYTCCKCIGELLDITLTLTNNLISFILNHSILCCLQIPPASKSFQEAQSELNQTAAELNQSAGEVVHASRGSSSQLAVASGKFSQDFDEFLDAGIEMAGHTQVGFVSQFQHLVINIKTVVARITTQISQ